MQTLITAIQQIPPANILPREKSTWTERKFTVGPLQKHLDTYFKNLKFGCANRYGKIYPVQSPGVELNEDTWTDADSIYIGTVFRDKSSEVIGISVTNDTNQIRTFRAYTSGGNYYDFEIEACPLWKDFNGRTFEDFPFDRLYTIPEYCEWIVCYETTGGTFNQVRYVNWENTELVLDKDSDGNITIHEVDEMQPPTTTVSDTTVATTTATETESTTDADISDNNSVNPVYIILAAAIIISIVFVVIKIRVSR